MISVIFNQQLPLFSAIHTDFIPSFFVLIFILYLRFSPIPIDLLSEIC